MGRPRKVKLDGEELRVSAVVHAGLALHRDAKAGWKLTHAASGLQVLPAPGEKFDSREHALLTLEELLPLADWERDVADLGVDESLAERRVVAFELARIFAP